MGSIKDRNGLDLTEAEDIMLFFFFQSTEVHQVSWFPCLESYKVKTKVLTGPCSFLEDLEENPFLCSFRFWQNLVLVVVGLRSHPLAGCQPGAVPSCQRPLSGPGHMAPSYTLRAKGGLIPSHASNLFCLFFHGISFSLTPLPPYSTFQGPSGYSEPSQIIRDDVPIIRSSDQQSVQFANFLSSCNFHIFTSLVQTSFGPLLYLPYTAILKIQNSFITQKNKTKPPKSLMPSLCNQTFSPLLTSGNQIVIKMES